RARSSAVTSSALRRAIHSLASRSTRLAFGRRCMSATIASHLIALAQILVGFARSARDVLLHGFWGNAQAQCNFLVRAEMKDLQREGGPTLGGELLDRFA